MARLKKSMTTAAAGRLGGLARAERLAAGEITIEPAGAAVPKPTICPRCGVEQPSARAAWVHCRKPRTKKKVGKKGTKS